MKNNIEATSDTPTPKPPTLKKRLSLISLLTLLGTWGSFAFAALESVTTFICGIGNSLSGPLGLSVGFVALTVAGIALSIGDRQAMGRVVRVILGIALIVSAGAIITSIFGATACVGAAPVEPVPAP